MINSGNLYNNILFVIFVEKKIIAINILLHTLFLCTFKIIPGIKTKYLKKVI